jgi:hypothetical protein
MRSLSSLGEEDPVTLTGRVDADIVLGLGRVGAERLDDESVEGTGGLLNGDRLAGTLLDPGASGLPGLVEAEEAGLSTTLDQLVGLADELGGEDPVGQTRARLDGRRKSLGLRVPARWSVRTRSGSVGWIRTIEPGQRGRERRSIRWSREWGWGNGGASRR